MRRKRGVCTSSNIGEQVGEEKEEMAARKLPIVTAELYYTMIVLEMEHAWIWLHVSCVQVLYIFQHAFPIYAGNAISRIARPV